MSWVTFSLETVEFQSAIQRFEDQLEASVKRAVVAGADAVAIWAHEYHSYENRTLRLESGTMGHEDHGSLREGLIYAEAVAHTDYASYVEEGTKHARPYPYMEPALKVTTPWIEDRISDALEEAVASSGMRR